jgi:hypothetical protein
MKYLILFLFCFLSLKSNEVGIKGYKEFWNNNTQIEEFPCLFLILEGNNYEVGLNSGEEFYHHTILGGQFSIKNDTVKFKDLFYNVEFTGTISDSTFVFLNTRTFLDSMQLSLFTQDTATQFVHTVLQDTINAKHYLVQWLTNSKKGLEELSALQKETNLKVPGKYEVIIYGAKKYRYVVVLKNNSTFEYYFNNRKIAKGKFYCKSGRIYFKFFGKYFEGIITGKDSFIYCQLPGFHKDGYKYYHFNKVTPKDTIK